MASEVPQWMPLALGLAAGITVYLGAWALYAARGRLSARGLGFLQAFAGGILAYLAMETGSEASEYVEELARPATALDFLVAAVATTLAFLATYMALSAAENRLRREGTALYNALVVAMALGIHNVGEGFAIAASLLAGAVASAMLFTVGFAVHNATEGFAVVGPLMGAGVRIRPEGLLGLSLLAGLPAVLGSAVYYAGVASGLFLAILNTVATASIVYAMLHINLAALGRLGGVSSPLFWLAITAGVVAAFGTESVILFSGLGG